MTECFTLYKYYKIENRNRIETTQHNVWPNENRDIETGVCVADRGFKRNLTQLNGEYD